MNFYRFSLVFFAVAIFSCSKETEPTPTPEPKLELATVNSSNPDEISLHSAKLGGSISDDGGASITEKGVVWGYSANPIEENGTKISEGSGTDSYTINLADLPWNTEFHVRAYAVNSVGIAYGQNKTFSTLPLTITTSEIALLTETEMTLYIDMHSPVSEEPAYSSASGFVYDTSPNPTTELLTKIEKSTYLGFPVELSGLDPGTTYYGRSYFTDVHEHPSNDTKIAYGEEVEFTTVELKYATIELSMNDRGNTWADLVASITEEGSSPPTSQGFIWGSTPSLEYETAENISNQDLLEPLELKAKYLTDETVYYRAYQETNVGYAYSNEIQLTRIDAPLAIGDFYQGGLISYIFHPTDNGYVAGETHGLVVSEYDLVNERVQWKCFGSSNNVDGADGTEIGSGLQNTLDIAASCVPGQTFYEKLAAHICLDYTFLGYDDWYLPSYDELMTVYDNKNLLTGIGVIFTSQVFQFGIAYQAVYWTSTRQPGFGEDGYWIDLSDTAPSGYDGSAAIMKAMRTF